MAGGADPAAAADDADDVEDDEHDAVNAAASAANATNRAPLLGWRALFIFVPWSSCKNVLRKS